MPDFCRCACVLVTVASVILMNGAYAQESKGELKAACVAPNEPIYRPGADGVKPPQPQPDRNAKNAPKIRGRVSIELVVGTTGRVCTATVISASDIQAAQKAANYVLEHWLFKPATRQGKAVAVRFTVNFNPS